MVQFLEFGHDTVCDAGDTFSDLTIHHSSYRVDFILDGEVEEVGVDEDVEGRTEVGVVVEER